MYSEFVLLLLLGCSAIVSDAGLVGLLVLIISQYGNSRKKWQFYTFFEAGFAYAFVACTALLNCRLKYWDSLCSGKDTAWTDLVEYFTAGGFTGMILILLAVRHTIFLAIGVVCTAGLYYAGQDRRRECSSCNHLQTGENILDYILCLFDEYTFHE
ncbi:uncharacterized protein LOC111699124 isoform X1 [Eurytemora carolleeae]|uniref:uncharacterized protein LOC111699124 isoform X1 n=1 Tax=Eurytemora carolleeae TaxID=1294199 RepID=UPI000C75E520|nr:uncharacterized protein LOC111699124 isoform X1 [Eurytemora carolleeae]|eukprot:XP_023325468.1 uncharacterized protein LOC111699124 isoform X1 [Eurytemora affinis]